MNKPKVLLKMKIKNIFLISALLIVLASCQKPYNCHCLHSTYSYQSKGSAKDTVWTTTTHVGDHEFYAGWMSKRRAKKTCSTYNGKESGGFILGDCVARSK